MEIGYELDSINDIRYCVWKKKQTEYNEYEIKCIGTLNFIYHISQILCCTVFAHCLHFILALRFA